MFGFGRKKSTKKRDNVIGLIASIIDQILPQEGYDSFSSGYIHINEGFEGAGWSSSPRPPLSAFSFKVTDIELHELLRDEIFSTQIGIHQTMTVDMYCGKVHEYLKANFKDYEKLDFLDARLS
jgi:hypothetical protein